MLRAAGVNYDIRKVDSYGIYDRFEFRVPLGDHGDVYDRYMIRVLEMRESLKILAAGARRTFPPARSWIRRRRCAGSARKPAKPTAASKRRKANLASI